MAKDMSASIEAAVLFDLMDRMKEAMGVSMLSMAATRTCLEWAFDNGLLRERVEYSGTPQPAWLGPDCGKVEPVTAGEDPKAEAMARMILGMPDQSDMNDAAIAAAMEKFGVDWADHIGTTIEPTTLPGEGQDAPGEGPLAPASAAAESTGGGQDLPPAPQDASPEAPPSCPGDAGGDAPPAAAEADPETSAAPLITGPMTDAEKAEVRRLHAEGLNGYMIAQRLNRRPQPILMMLTQKGGRPKKAPATIAIAEGPETAAAEAPEAGGARPAWWREIEANLRTIGYKGGWTLARDLMLAEGIEHGTPWPMIADDMGAEVRALRQRWIALTPAGQKPWQIKQLLEVLRAVSGRMG